MFMEWADPADQLAPEYSILTLSIPKCQHWKGLLRPSTCPQAGIPNNRPASRNQGVGSYSSSLRGCPTQYPPPPITSATSLSASLALGHSSPDTWPVCCAVPQSPSAPCSGCPLSGVPFPERATTFHSEFIFSVSPALTTTLPCNLPPLWIFLPHLCCPDLFFHAFMTFCPTLLLVNHTHCLSCVPSVICPLL